MTDETNSILPQELLAISNSKTNLEMARLKAENAVAAVKVAELEHKSLILEIFNKYKIDATVQGISPHGEIINLPKNEVEQNG